MRCGSAARASVRAAMSGAPGGVSSGPRRRTSSPSGSAQQMMRDVLTLSKYRLSGLVALTAGTGYALRADRDDRGLPADPRFHRELVATTAGTYLAAAAANALNHTYERHSDALMARTRLRPLPAGRLRAAHAVAFAALSATAGVGLLAHETNNTAAALAAANVVLYAGVYTPLKAMSTINTWVGSIVGALPPMLGWAAASGGDLTSQRERGAWAFGATLFLWQIPHFHALAVVARADYAAGGLRMLAVSNPVANALWARITAAALVPAGVALAATDTTNDIFAFESAALAAWMYRGANRLSLDPTSISAARSLFKVSIVHLPVVMALMLFHRTSPRERQAAYDLDMLRRKQALQSQSARMAGSDRVYYHPWETLAPFPFLPLPLLVPVAVKETSSSCQSQDSARLFSVDSK